MAEYKLEVSTGDQPFAEAFTLDCCHCIYVTIIGTEGKSKRTNLDNTIAGKEWSYTVKTSLHLGQLLLVKLEKDNPFKKRKDDDPWFCSKIVVTTPEDDVILFPCYRWIYDRQQVELRGGKAMKAFEDVHPLLTDHRKTELKCHNDLYQWGTWSIGQRLPHIASFKDSSEIPDEACFSRAFELAFEKRMTNVELKLRGIFTTEQWNIEAMKKVFWLRETPMSHLSEYVSVHWMEDDFYGFQFLNGINPNMIQRCLELPHNFPVTEEMVKPFFDSCSSLQREMKKGNILLCDYKGLVGLSTKVDNGEVLPLTPGLCLFYMIHDKLMPIAIQLTQQPSEQNPIFLPSDPECDWLLAKLFVKHADTIYHQFVYHVLNTHFLAEAFAVATLRSFPVIHPLYKLLIPHFRYTFQINVVARQLLLAPGGPMFGTSLTPDGIGEFMGRAHSETTYSSLCLPENIRARGLESVPNFYYRDDGLKLWNIINSFVKAIVDHYYPSDSDVCRDSELQDWINEIFTHAFLGNESSGIPAAFHTVEEVTRFITMLIFNVSCQHAAVHLGQFEYGCWVPNSPLLLRKAPPTMKGQSSMKTFFETLPTVGQSVPFLAWVIAKKYEDSLFQIPLGFYPDEHFDEPAPMQMIKEFQAEHNSKQSSPSSLFQIPLGFYPDEHFDEPAPKQMIKEFQAELSFLSEAIEERNEDLVVPYNYLNPTEIENSITF